MLLSQICFFFFQAEDGIRDLYVTGVQTCALPICPLGRRTRSPNRVGVVGSCPPSQSSSRPRVMPMQAETVGAELSEIGRASCRERVEISVVGVAVKKKDG